MQAQLLDVADRYVTELVVWVDNKGEPPATIRHYCQTFRHCGQTVPDNVAIYRSGRASPPNVVNLMRSRGM
jgi:hypothetical protein